MKQKVSRFRRHFLTSLRGNRQRHFSAFLGDLTGQIFAMFVLAVAAGEAAVGLAILVIFFRDRGTIAVDDVNRMKG